MDAQLTIAFAAGVGFASGLWAMFFFLDRRLLALHYAVESSLTTTVTIREVKSAEPVPAPPVEEDAHGE